MLPAAASHLRNIYFYYICLLLASYGNSEETLSSVDNQEDDLKVKQHGGGGDSSEAAELIGAAIMGGLIGMGAAALVGGPSNSEFGHNHGAVPDVNWNYPNYSPWYGNAPYPYQPTGYYPKPPRPDSYYPPPGPAYGDDNNGFLMNYPSYYSQLNVPDTSAELENEKPFFYHQQMSATTENINEKDVIKERQDVKNDDDIVGYYVEYPYFADSDFHLY